VRSEPLVVVDSDRSNHQRRQIDVDDAVLGELVVQLIGFTVVEIDNEARR